MPSKESVLFKQLCELKNLREVTIGTRIQSVEDIKMLCANKEPGFRLDVGMVEPE